MYIVRWKVKEYKMTSWVL